jgi:hypothetical protein
MRVHLIAIGGSAMHNLAIALHEKGIQVVPLVGPSSILLALMASGMNGQSFAFNGYLPIDKNDKKQALKTFERLSFEKNQVDARDAHDARDADDAERGIIL